MKILVLDKISDSLIFKLTQRYDIEEDYFSSKKEIENKVKNFEGIIIRSRFKIEEGFLNKAEKLKFIARFGVGLENIDVDYAQKKGIIVFNSQEGNSQAVAEHTIGLILSLSKKITISNNKIKYHNLWERENNRGFEINGKVLGIIGYGNIGKTLAKYISGFGVDVIAYDIKKKYSDEFCKEVSMQEIFRRADILSVHTPLTEITNQMCNDNFFQRFSKKIIFINTARGKIVKTKDLIKNIENGKIIGAGLDVLEYEKSSFENIEINKEIEFLKNKDNVILTPHVGGWSVESNEKMGEIIFQKIISL